MRRHFWASLLAELQIEMTARAFADGLRGSMRKFIQASVVVLWVAAPRLVAGQDGSTGDAMSPPPNVVQASSANQAHEISVPQAASLPSTDNPAAASAAAADTPAPSGANEATAPSAADSEMAIAAQSPAVQEASSSNGRAESMMQGTVEPVQDVNADVLPFGHITLGLAFSALQRMDKGMQIFEAAGYAPQFVLNAGYDTEIASRLRLGGEMSWGIAVASNDNYSGGNLAADALEHRALLSAVMSLALHPRFWPHVRLGGGLSATKVHINGDATGAGVNDWLLAPMAEVAAGATFQWPVGRNAANNARALRIGIRLEGGYGVVKKNDVSLMLPAAHAVSTQLGNLGSLHTGGALLRIGLVVRF